MGAQALLLESVSGSLLCSLSMPRSSGAGTLKSSPMLRNQDTDSNVAAICLNSEEIEENVGELQKERHEMKSDLDDEAADDHDVKEAFLGRVPQQSSRHHNVIKF